jgi:hypothetical protein
MTTSTQHIWTCEHQPRCPRADATDREAVRVTAQHPEQGWSLLCNGVIVFDDCGDLLPDGQVIAPHCGPARHRPPNSAAAAGAPPSTHPASRVRSFGGTPPPPVSAARGG